MELDPEEELEGSFLPAYALARNILFSDYDRKTARYSKTQIAILAVLYWHEKMCMSEISELIAAPRPQTTRAMILLADDGLVERFAAKENRKLVYIRLTDNGKQFIKNYLHERFNTLRDKLSEAESMRLAEATKTIVDILNKKLAQNRERIASGQ